MHFLKYPLKTRFSELMEDLFKYGMIYSEHVFAEMQISLHNLEQKLCDYFLKEIQNNNYNKQLQMHTKPVFRQFFSDAEIPTNMKEVLKLEFFSQNPDQF